MGNSSSSNSKKNNATVFYDSGNTSVLLENCLKKLHAKLLNINELDEHLKNELRTGLCSDTYVNWLFKNKQRYEPLYKRTLDILNQMKSKPTEKKRGSQNLSVTSDMIKDIKDNVYNILNEKNSISVPHGKAEMWHQQVLRYSNNLKFYNEEKNNNRRFTQAQFKDDERVKKTVQNEMTQNLNYNKNRSIIRHKPEDLNKVTKPSHQAENVNSAKYQDLIKKIESKSEDIKLSIQKLDKAINNNNGQSLFEERANYVQKLNNDFIKSNQDFIKELFPDLINHFNNMITSFYDTKLDEIYKRYQIILKKFNHIQDISEIELNRQDTNILYKELEIIQNVKSKEIKQRLNQHLDNLKKKEEEFKTKNHGEKPKNIQYQYYPQKQSPVITYLDSRTEDALTRFEYSKAKSIDQIDTAGKVEKKYDRPKRSDFKQIEETVQFAQTKNDKPKPVNEEEELKIVSLEEYFTFNPKNLKEEFGSIAYMDKILEEARKYEYKVKKFKDVNHSVEYFVLDENLMKLTEYMDKIKCTKTELERKRKKNQVLKYIESLHDILDDNVIEEIADVFNNDKNNKPTAKRQSTNVINQAQDKKSNTNIIPIDNEQGQLELRKVQINQTSNLKTKETVKIQLQSILHQQCDEIIEKMNRLFINFQNYGRQEQYTIEFEKLCDLYKGIQSNSSEIQDKLFTLNLLESKIKELINESYYVKEENKTAINANHITKVNVQQNDEKLVKTIKKAIQDLNVLKMQLDINQGSLQQHINEFKKIDEQFKNVQNNSNDVLFAIKELNSTKTAVNSRIQNKIEINDLQNLHQDYSKICNDIQKSPSIVENLNHFKSQLESILHKIIEFKNNDQHFVLARNKFNQKLQNTLMELDRRIHYINNINIKMKQIDEINTKSTKIQRADLTDESKRSGYNSLHVELFNLKIGENNIEVLQKIKEIEKTITNLIMKLPDVKKEKAPIGYASNKQNTHQTFQETAPTNNIDQNSTGDGNPKNVSLEKYFSFNPENLKEEFGSIPYMNKILEEARKYESKVKNFKDVNHSVEYFILDENLMKLIEVMDKIKCAKEELDRKRKKTEVLRYIHSLHAILDDKIIEDY